jgi:hypothetical protein
MNRIYLGMGIVGLIVLTVVMAFFQGKDHERKIWELKYKEAQNQILMLEATLPVINEIVVTEYVDRIRYVDKVRVKKEVITEYITVENNEQCVINQGFVTIHDAAATAQPLPAPKPEDQLPSNSELTDVAAVVADNYATYHELKAQLEALQQWIRMTQAEWNKRNE